MLNFADLSRRRMLVRSAFVALMVLSLSSPIALSAAAAAPSAAKKIVILAGTVHQGPGGHPPGTHEYELSARLLKRALDTAEASQPKVEVHAGGWPGDPKTLDDADTIVVISDGADRNEQDHPLLVGDRLQTLKKQMDRGCGLVALHWTVFVPRERGGPEFLEWIGGYFDYQSGDAPNHWLSKIQTASTRPQPATPDHPICRGLAPFALREEYYYNIRFRPNDRRLVPILKTRIPSEAAEQVVAWAVERAGGGRGFGFTGGHFFENWGIAEFRRMVLNSILWTAHIEVPAGGFESPAPDPPEPAVAADDPPIQAVIVTGHQHPAHLWRETTVALQEALGQDRRFHLTVVTDPEFLATKNLFGHSVVVFNYCNWQRAGLSDAAKENFQKYLAAGGGLVLIHFANGAFHASLPETPPSDWPEYRAICRRVWDHAPGRSSHDPFGRFTVKLAADHPITYAMNSFETVDELYCNQQGDQPIEVLATARSTVTGKDEPMAFVYRYGEGRVFQTVLGHAAESIRTPGESALIRRGAVWAAGQPQRAVGATPQAVRAAPKLIPVGRYGAALDPRQQAAVAPRKEIYEKRPLTVECWTQLASKTGFNILVANSAKESAEHWEVYSYAGSGELSLYLPGFVPAEIRSGVDITDGKWHYVAASIDETQARLYVDGKLVKEAAISRARSGGPAEALFFGGYPPHGIGCDGWIDEVRISNAVRNIVGLPTAPFSADEHTIGLWHFDRIESGKVEDASQVKNPLTSAGGQAASGPLLARRAADPELKLVTIDTSPDESFLSMRLDTMGRLFVGGREALFVYEPNAQGGFQPRQLLYRFGPDTWITDILVRGDDLYVMTNAALYLLPGGRIARENLVPRRLLWGSPVDLHVTWHGLAWGPEGDLYFSSGDPLLNYGDFQNRPDHWGHWTLHGPPGDTKIPYTGVGGFFRCRSDGTRFRVVAGGTRGAVGIAFDRRWNLFSNDNDHESIADRYSPARLLHVAPHAHFFWPRGWIAAMSPERSDLLDVVNAGMGREAPVGQTYYDETRLGPKYRDSLFVARWGQRKVDGFALRTRGASFEGSEFPLLIGEESARPVGVAVGRDGRLFVSLSYMAANEWSPKYPSEVLMVTRVDDPPTHPFEAYDAPSAAAARLWDELSQPSCWRRQQAHVEILRRGGPLLKEAIARLRGIDRRDPAMMHLPWLAAASGLPAARTALVALAAHADPDVRALAVRALGEFPVLGAGIDVFQGALADSNLHVQHAAVVALFDRPEELPPQLFSGPARSRDATLRQASAFLIGDRATPAQLNLLLDSVDPSQRLAGVLAAGFRLTVPPSLGELPQGLPLRYESTNALFTISYADATVDLKKLGPVGSFTTAERWKSVPPSRDERRLVDALVARLADGDDRVHFQAAYFLSLLDDPRANQLVADARRARTLDRLQPVPAVAIRQAWRIGPFDDGRAGFDTVHAPQTGPIELTASVAAGSTSLTWQAIKDGEFILPGIASGAQQASSYLYFRLQSLQAQSALLSVEGPRKAKAWHNGRPLEASSPFILPLEAGSNDVLLRLAHGDRVDTVRVSMQAAGAVEATLPEKLAPSGLAERLRNAGSSEGRVGDEFLAVDWQTAATAGDAERGRRLFAVGGLGCAKCHAILPGQKGGGAPSLAGAAERFTLAHVVESILVPGKQVAPVFGTTTVATQDGKTFAGLAVEEDERQLVLLLPTAERQAVPKSNIEDRKLQATSPMPSGLVKTPAELGDLLAYLMSARPQAP
jgi:putative heme-binding domain-containing protein